MFFNYFVVSFLFLISIDLFFKLSPKSKLIIKPLKYKLSSSNNKNIINFEFEIFNLSSKKETMIPELDFELQHFNEGSFELVNYSKEINILDGDNISFINNYWQTIIVKANSSIKVNALINLNEELIKDNNFIWLKVNWQNYGHFGLIKKQNNYLLNDYRNFIKNRKINKININKGYEAIAIKTLILGVFDDPYRIVIDYCRDIIKEGDIIVIGETPLAIMQGRYINPVNIKYNFLAKLLCYFFHPTSSLATACGMQLLIDKVGVTRIIYSLLIGFLFKLFGVKGLFYRLAGVESSLIDDISGTTKPYDKSIVMGPININSFCNKITKELKVDSAIVDVNDLGGVKILGSSNKSIEKVLNQVLKNNPAGNDDQKTPILLIRKKA